MILARGSKFLYAVTEAHQLVGLGLDAFHEGAGTFSTEPISSSIFSTAWLAPAVGRAPQAGDAGGDTCKRVGARGASQTHGGGGGVLLVVGVQDEDAIQRLGQHLVGPCTLRTGGEHHVQEVLG